MKELVLVFRILNACADGVALVHGYAEPMSELLRLCSMAHLKEKMSDEIVYEQIAIECTEQFGRFILFLWIFLIFYWLFGLNYIANFAKIRFFKISVILYFSVGLLYYLFFVFFLPPNFISRRSTNLHQIWHKCVLPPGAGKDKGDFWKVQNPGHNSQRPKNWKICQFFTHAVTFSFVVTKRLKIFEKSFQHLPLGGYSFKKISLWQSWTL